MSYQPLQRIRSRLEARLRGWQTPRRTRSKPPPPVERGDAPTRLNLLSFNIQTGISSGRYRDYLTGSWQHVLPSSQRMGNLDQIARQLHRFDMVGLQEIDAGSLRSGFVNQAEYLAMRAGFPFWRHQLNRNIGKLAQHSNALLSKVTPTDTVEYRLPGMIPGRGVLVAHYGRPDNPLLLLVVHLALGSRARRQQLGFIADLVSGYRNVIIMGDMNCRLQGLDEARRLFDLDLHAPGDELMTFPSWQPERGIDHILVSPSIHVTKLGTLPIHISDHLPVAMEVEVPADVALHGATPHSSLA